MVLVNLLNPDKRELALGIVFCAICTPRAIRPRRRWVGLPGDAGFLVQIAKLGFCLPHTLSYTEFYQVLVDVPLPGG